MGIEHLQNQATPRRHASRYRHRSLKASVSRKPFLRPGRFPATATANDKYLARAYSVGDRLLDRWVKTSETYYRKKVRTVCYLSAEFLLGPRRQMIQTLRLMQLL